MDEKLLGHILSNLLSNATKYSPTGSTVKFTLTCQEGRAVFGIQDQGIGIPPEDFPRLFESFSRATNVGNIQGTGLGLAIVKKCVDMHKGEIAVTEEAGEHRGHLWQGEKILDSPACKGFLRIHLWMENNKNVRSL